MSNNKFKITVVDDNPADIHLLVNALEGDYQINAASSAKEAFELFTENKPDLILLDINMPEMDGYEACQLIKQNPELQDIDVIFLSANDNTNEIVRGLELGAVDYIVKPYDTELLLKKVYTALKRIESEHALKQRADEANQIVYTMLSESAGLSTTINYFRECFSAANIDDLLHSTINALHSINLSCVVYFHITEKEALGSSSGEATMLESELVRRFTNFDQPFFEQGERLFVIQKQLVVLIKNMPLEQEKRGSLKDHLMTLLEGCSAKLAYFSKLNTASGKKLLQIKSAIQQAQLTLAKIQAQQEQHKKRSVEMMDTMLAEVEASFFNMGLTDTQEQSLLSILSTAGQAQLEHMEKGLQLDEEVKQAVLHLSKAATEVLS